jgi:pimeloyl-ACP methyl ester carboxylesterase
MNMEVKLERPRRYFVDTSRGYIHVQDCGAGDKVIGLVTITSFGGVILDHALPLFAQRGYRAVAFDMMGYGLSDKKSAPWTMEEFADNIEEAARMAIGRTPDVFVFGHFSGLIGIEIAARNPAGLKGLVIDGTPLIAKEQQDAYKPGVAPPPPIEWKEDGSHAIAFWNRAYGLIKRANPDVPLDPNPPKKVREAYLAYLAVASFEPGSFEAYHGFDVRSRVKDIDIPVQCMCSDTDWNLPHHPFYLQNIRNSREVRFPGVHPLHDIYHPERAPEYVDAIEAFYRAIA